MPKINLFPRLLALFGLVLAWIPLLAPIFLSAIRLFTAHRFQLDYLMPAELFPFAWAGGALLIWAAFRARRWIGQISASVAASVFLFFAVNGIAITTGLASGRTEPTGFPYILVLTCLALFSLALLAAGVYAFLLLRDLLKPTLSTSY
jgi:hypothetical protein